ncbi:helix-turn-helix domain-containing protein [Archangium primigenium]|uniref:helix-turn-helix domain-containing protein n=1 Tax=[Archangium] primigenium TaxID=2792470 RepID=UPI00195E7E5A|nr:helix-turn-helix domain-containing protein [Archangium primigenium]MBM7115710.1 helix-turn-helix domain-containing protein [Archangium primigenium]
MSLLELSPEQTSELETCFRDTEDRRLRERCQAVLMTARGRPQPQIAEDLGTTTRNVQRFLARYRAGGLEGLRIRWAPGRTPLIPEELTETILSWIRQGPEACGVARASWTHVALADFLHRQSGIRVQETAMGDFCRRHGVRLYRPTYRFLRADPERQRQARRELGEKNSRPSEASLSY